MNQREADIKTIAHEFAVWETKLANLNALNLTDGNVIAEYTIAAVLNLIFGYQLKPNKQPNQASIDLSDAENRIAYQISVTKSTQKVRETIDKFVSGRLYENYDQLFVLVLGRKQNSYPKMDSKGFPFAPASHVLDFQDLLKQVNLIPSGRLRELALLLARENKPPTSARSNSADIFRKSQAIRKKIEKYLVKKDLRELYNVIGYDPSYKFIYARLIVRSIDDRKYPDLDPDRPAWFRLELWDFYDHGLEFIGLGREILYDKELLWDFLDDVEDPRLSNPDYRHGHFHSFMKIAFDDMEDYDPETDGYYGYPSLFCHFRHDHEPYIEYTWGRMGDYKKKTTTFKFDPSKRTNLP